MFLFSIKASIDALFNIQIYMFLDQENYLHQVFQKLGLVLLLKFFLEYLFQRITDKHKLQVREDNWQIW